MRTVFRWIAALFFVAAGLNHFRQPEIYLGMMPPWLPVPETMNVISGAAEVLGGLGLLLPLTRRFAGWGLVLLLVAVFPANLHVALQGYMPGVSIPSIVLWLRLPVQVLMIMWVWWVAQLSIPRQQTPEAN